MDNDEFALILWDEHDDYEAIGNSKIEDAGRWSIYYSQIVKQISTGKMFCAYWGQGATEMQDGQSEHWSLIEVEPKEVTIIQYHTVKDGLKHEGYSD